MALKSLIVKFVMTWELSFIQQSKKENQQKTDPQNEYIR